MSQLPNAMLQQIANGVQNVEECMGSTTESESVGSKRAAPAVALASEPVVEAVKSGEAARIAKKRAKQAARKAQQEATKESNATLQTMARMSRKCRKKEQAEWRHRRDSIDLNSGTDLNESTLKEVLKLVREQPALFCLDIDLFKEPRTDEERVQFASDEAKLKRADIVAAVSGQIVEVDAINEACKEYLPHLQRVMNLKNALINNSPLEHAEVLRDSISEAESQDRIAELAQRERTAFIEDYRSKHGKDPAPSEIPCPSCPHGDIVFGPSMTMAPPRFGKSWPAIGFALCCRFLDCDILWAVAPNKTVVMHEMLKKLRLCGAEESDLIVLGHTLDVKAGEKARLLATDPNVNFLVWASDEHTDTEIYANRCEYLKAEGRMMVHIFDEADTLIKPEKKHKDTTLHIIRRFFPTSWGYRMLIGATMLPLMQERQLWGTLLDECNDDEEESMSIYRPLGALRPIMGKNGKKYTSMQDTVDVKYDGKKFTKQGVIVRAKFIALQQCQYRISDMTRLVLEAQSPERKEDATAVGHPLNKKFNGLPMQEIRICVDNDFALKQSMLQRLQKLFARMQGGDFGPLYPHRANSKLIVRESDADEAFLPKGLVPWGLDPIATAKIELYFESVLQREPCLQTQDGHYINQMIVATITQQVKDSKLKTSGKEVAGFDGQMGFWAARFAHLAEANKVNLALLVYSTQLTRTAIEKNCFGYSVCDTFKAKLPVKLFEVRTERHADGAVTTNKPPVTSWEDSEAAFAYLHDYTKSLLTHNTLLRTHVFVLGYDMLKAATTIANERTLEIAKPDGSVAVGGMLYSPKYIVFAHNDDRQLNALLQMFGRALNQVSKEFVVADYKVHALTHKETLDMLRVYAQGEVLLAEFFCSAVATDTPYCKVMSGLKQFFQEQKAWHGDITAAFLGLRRIQIQTQFAHVGQLAADEIRELMAHRPEDAYGDSYEDDLADDHSKYTADGQQLPSSQGRGKAKLAYTDDEEEAGVDNFKSCKLQVGSIISTRAGFKYSYINKDIWQPHFNEMPKCIHTNFVKEYIGNLGKPKPALNSISCERFMKAVAAAISLISRLCAAYPLVLTEFGNVTAEYPKRLMWAVAKYPLEFTFWATQSLPADVRPADTSVEQMQQNIRTMARVYFEIPSSSLVAASSAAGCSSDP